MENILNDENALRDVKEMLQSWPWGYAYHRILLDDRGNPVDYEFLYANKAFEDLTGLKRKDIVGHRATEVLPGIEKSEFDWIGFYGKIALEQRDETFEQFSEILGRWYQVQAFSSEKGYFTTLFVDITSEKQRAEELENFFAVNLDLLCIADAEGNFIKVNRAWEGILGYAPEELRGRRFLEFVHPEDLKKTLNAMEQLEKEEDVLNFVNRYRSKDGTYRFIEWRSHPKGRFIYAAARDITERLAAEVRLKESRERLSLALDAGGHGYWDLNLETDVFYLSPRNYTMLGYEEGEFPMTWEVWAELLHPEDRESVISEVEKCRRKESFYELEFRLRCKNGSYAWIGGRGKSYSLEGIAKPSRVVGVQVDIQERKEREEYSHHLSNIVEQIHEPILETDTDFCITYMNRAAEQLTGYTLEEVRGKKTHFFSSSLEEIENHEKMYQIVKEKGRAEWEFVNKRRNGEEYIVRAMVNSLRDTRGILRGYASFRRDVTEERRMLRELQEQREQFQLVLRGTDDGIWDWDIRGGKLFLSEHWKKMLGYEDRELENKFESFSSLLWEEDREWVLEYMESYLREEVPKYSLEFRMKHKNGSFRWILSKGEALRDEKGLPYRMVGSHSDITERKKIELQLARERERLTSILEGTRAGTWEWNVRTGEIILNERWAEMLGYTLEELQPLSIAIWKRFSHPEDVERSEKLLEKHFRGELEYYENEIRMKHCKGHWIWVQDRGKVARWTEDGKPLLMSGTHQDITERKENEERLKSSEENFRTFFETLDDLMIIGKPGGAISYTNPAVTEKLGYTPEELKKMNVLDLHPESVRGEAEQIFKEMFEGRQHRCPLPLKAKNGTLLSVETRIWFGSWNGEEALFGISKDLTKEQEAFQKFNKLFESNPALMAVTRVSDLKIIEVNQAFLTVLEFDREEVIGKTNSELGLFVDPEQREEIGAILRESRSIRNVDLKLRAKSGKIREGIFSAEVIESQGEPYFLTVMTDITERKRAEREVALQTEMLEVLMHTAKACINMSLEEIEGTVEFFLGEISRFVGAQRAYVFYYSWNEKTYSNSYEWCEEGVLPQKRSLQNIPLERISGWAESHKKGKTIYIPDIFAFSEEEDLRKILVSQGIKSLIAVPMMRGGECLGFVEFDAVKTHHIYSDREKALLEIFAEIMVNLKIRKNLESRLIEEKENAQAASRAKSEFLANMSHEIRTPLNGVIGFTDLLQSTPLSPIQEQYVQNANASGHALLGIVSDILDFSKIEAGKLELEIVKTDLIDLVEQSVNIVRYGADQKKLEVLLDLDLEMPRYVFVDPVRLKQVLANLLSNAVKFTEKGEVALKVRYSPQESNRGVFTFSVRDTGIGMDEKQQKKLFKAFSQADASTTRKFGGSGLGLAISDKLVRKMGGILELESAPHQGSTFFFSIEVFCEEGERADHGHIEGVFRVLVIDDNPNNRTILEHMLAHWGIDFVGAEDVPEALKILEEAEKPFDVLIMDYHMPYVNGLEGIRMIREDLKLSPKEQPIILLHSSADDAELLEHCRKLGVRFRLIKPIQSEELFTYLSDLRRGNPEAFPEEMREPLLLLPEEELQHFNTSALVQELGDFQALKTLVEASRVALPTMLEFLEKALESGSSEELAKEVRVIKRSAGVMHFLRLQKLTESLETLCIEEFRNVEKAQAMMVALRQEWNFLEALLERESWKKPL